MTASTCSGMQAAGVAAGLKKNGQPDLGLIYSKTTATAAAVFTRNVVQAAPVMLDRQRIPSGRCRAIVVNSGNANCCNGENGMRDALATCAAVARALNIPEDQVLVASTGVIGQPLPMDRVTDAVPTLVADLAGDGFERLAAAIMTTDTEPKCIHRQGQIGDRAFNVVAVAKGAGMIRPDMATMLCFACTDAAIDAALLDTMLRQAVDQSFNRITIDGDTSTNDTVILLANGSSGAAVKNASEQAVFQALLDAIFLDLAKWLVRDGEGANKLVEVRVQGTGSDEDARRIADTVADSPLVKTALFGEDANWGRILGAAGRAGVTFDPAKMDLYFDEVRMVAGGVGCGAKAEAAATAVLKKSELTITLDLNNGSGSASVLTCDFSLDYVRINADYRS
jgi:glutamate N-acetyltransferase / amino-acid N-acetyltransferase